MILNCPECGKRLRVSDELAGRKGKCPACGTTIQVPRADKEALAGDSVAGHLQNLRNLSPKELKSLLRRTLRKRNALRRRWVRQKEWQTIKAWFEASKLALVLLAVGGIILCVCSPEDNPFLSTFGGLMVICGGGYVIFYLFYGTPRRPPPFDVETAKEMVSLENAIRDISRILGKGTDGLLPRVTSGRCPYCYMALPTKAANHCSQCRLNWEDPERIRIA